MSAESLVNAQDEKCAACGHLLVAELGEPIRPGTCDCKLCIDCAGGIVHTCPVCGTEGLRIGAKITEEEYERHDAEWRSEKAPEVVTDTSALKLLAASGLVVLALFLLAWIWEHA